MVTCSSSSKVFLFLKSSSNVPCSSSPLPKVPCSCHLLQNVLFLLFPSLKVPCSTTSIFIVLLSSLVLIPTHPRSSPVFPRFTNSPLLFFVRLPVSPIFIEDSMFLLFSLQISLFLPSSFKISVPPLPIFQSSLVSPRFHRPLILYLLLKFPVPDLLFPGSLFLLFSSSKISLFLPYSSNGSKSLLFSSAKSSLFPTIFFKQFLFFSVSSSKSSVFLPSLPRSCPSSPPLPEAPYSCALLEAPYSCPLR
jgi:hypothetical protein